MQLVPTGKAAKIGALLKNAGYTFAFKTLGSGRIVINWYYLPKGAKLSNAKPKPKPLLIASGIANFSKKGVVKIKIKLNTRGKQMLKAGKTLKLTSKGTYTPTGGAAVTATKTFTVKR